MTNPHMYDIGTILKVKVMDGTIVADISTATIMKIILTKKDKTTVAHDAYKFTDGKDGIMAYTTQSRNDLDQAGDWYIQGYLEMPTWAGHTDTKKFTVSANQNPSIYGRQSAFTQGV